MFGRKLEGHRVALLATDGFEQVELTGPLKALEKAGATVEILSLHRGKIRGNNLFLPGKRVKVSRLIKGAEPQRYDALLIPGGHINPDLLRVSPDVLRFVSEMDRAGKPIATLCHGPWVLISAGLARGRHMTSWPNIKEDLRNAGVKWSDEPVVRDRNLLTSRGPHDLRAFEKAMVALFAETEPHDPVPSRGPRRWLGALVAGGMVYALRKVLGGLRSVQPAS